MGKKKKKTPPRVSVYDPVVEPPPVAPGSRNGEEAFRYWDVVIAAFLGVAVLLVFGSAVRQQFIAYDDMEYVADNPHITGGLTWDNLYWALTSPHMGNYHPVTMLSYLLEAAVFGVHAGEMKAINVALHLLSTVLLFFLLRRWTGSRWPSALVAALFALHPLHVEPVLWVASRKDMLSGCFMMLTLLAYGAYARRPSLGRYVPVAVLFAVGVFSKPVLVTLPFALLLLDFWPLGRLSGAEGAFSWGVSLRRALEKLPLLAFAIVCMGATMFSQKAGGAVASLDLFPLYVRVENAIVAYAAYLWMTAWPSGLAIHYPHPGAAISLLKVVAAVCFLGAISVVVLWQRKEKYLPVGWLWYLGVLVPMIGLIQVGGAAMADRYSYLPLIGVFIMIAFSLERLARVRPAWRVPVAAGCAGWVVALAVASWVQAGYWQNSETIFSHAIAATGTNVRMQYNLGNELYKKGRRDEALKNYIAVLKTMPDHVDANYNTGIYYMDAKRYAEALPYYQRAAGLAPARADIRLNLANTLYWLGRKEEALTSYREAIALDGSNPEPHTNMANVLVAFGQYDEALQEYLKALSLNPNHANTLYNLGNEYLRRGDMARAIASYQNSLRVDPGNADVHSNLGTALFQTGDAAGAETELREALRLNPSQPFATASLAGVLMNKGDNAAAAELFARLVQADPNNAQYQYNYGVALAASGHAQEAVAAYRQAVALAPGYADARNNLGNLLRDSGDIEGAREQYTKALEAIPEHPKAKANLEKLPPR